MSKRFNIALDGQSDRAIHISEVPESYSNAICSDCLAPLVTANRNQDNRKVASYFRHKRGQGGGCSSMTALHKYAQQILQDKCKVFLPAFSCEIFPDGGAPSPEPIKFSRRGYLANLNDVVLEDAYPTDEKFIADVVGGEAVDTKLYVEIWVHHQVDPAKRKALQAAKLDVIEVDLTGLIDKPDISREVIEESVLRSAPRQWIAHQRFDTEISALKGRVKELSEVSEVAIKSRRRVVLTMEELSLLKQYADVSNRRKAIETLRRRLEKRGRPENETFQWLIQRYGFIPNIVNIPIEGELGFEVHRIHWQTIIFLELQRRFQPAGPATGRGSATLNALLAGAFSDQEVTPMELYEYLKKSGIRLTKVAKIFEDIAGEPLSESYQCRSDSLPSIMPADYRRLPKPLLAVKRYLKALVELGFLSHFENEFSPIRGRRLDILARLEELPKQGVEGIVQYEG